MNNEYPTLRNQDFEYAQLKLRARAEKRREQVATPVLLTDGMPPQNLLQEIQIQQVEMELQYEELLTLQAETESLRARYTELFEYAPVGYVTLDILGQVQELNQAGALLLHTARHRLTNRRFLQFIAPNSRQAFLQLMVDVLASHEPVTLDVWLLREGDADLRVRLNGISLPDPRGNRLCRLALTDITPETPLRRVPRAG